MSNKIKRRKFIQAAGSVSFAATASAAAGSGISPRKSKANRVRADPVALALELPDPFQLQSPVCYTDCRFRCFHDACPFIRTCSQIRCIHRVAGEPSLSGPGARSPGPRAGQDEIMEKLRRQSRRHDLHAPHAPLLRWRGQSGEHDGCISEISLNGCFLNTRGDASVGEIITFRTQLPTGQKVELHAEAVHHDKRLVGYGLRFVYTTPEERMFVAQLIAEATDPVGAEGK